MTQTRFNPNPPPRHVWVRSGRDVDPLNLRPEDIDIRDIAHALAHLCRWRGHCNRFYSVAEHSIWATYLVPPEARLHALLHDAAEAYLLDLPTPLKALMPEYRRAEARAEAVIFERFGIDPAPTRDAVKAADAQLARTEAELLMHCERAERKPGEHLAATLIRTADGRPEYIRQVFLGEFHMLTLAAVGAKSSDDIIPPGHA